TTTIELEPGYTQPVLKNFGVVTGRGARQTPTHVEVVGRGDGEGDALPLPEDGLDDKDVGDVHPAVEGVVEDKHIARVDVIAKLLKQCGDGERDRAEVERDGHTLGDHLALGVGQRGGIV